MQILITGGAGYLGCHLVKLLADRGHSVRVFDRVCFTEAVARDLAALPNCTFIKGDMRHLDRHPDLLAGVDAIVHLAGLSNDPSCDLDADMALEVNLEGTRHLAKRAVREGVRRFVLASSCSVYGKGVFDVLDEESPTNPLTVYAQTKLQSEEIILALAGPNFEPVIARPATLFGWSPRMRFDLAINQMTATAARNKCINVFGGGRQWRPFVHVRDAARVFADMCEAPAAAVAGQVFNVGSDERNYTIIDLAQRVSALFDDVTIDVVKDDEDPRSYNVQFGKLKRVLGFESEWDVEAGAKEIQQFLGDEAINPFDTIFFNVRRMKELLALPVAQGGEPVAPRPIGMAPSAQTLALTTGSWLIQSGNGDGVQSYRHEVESCLSALYGRHAITTHSRSAAIAFTLLALGIGREDELVTSALGQADTLAALMSTGARVRFADVNANDLHIDPSQLDSALTDRTRAIVATCVDGSMSAHAHVYAAAAARGIPVIDDATGGLALDLPRPDGAIVTCAALAPLTHQDWAGGGVILTTDADLAGTIRRIVQGRAGRSMAELEAASVLAQLDDLKRAIAVRRRLARMYDTALADLPAVRPLFPAATSGRTWPWMTIRVEESHKESLAQSLALENVCTATLACALPAHTQAISQYGAQEAEYPTATLAASELLFLPLHDHMSEKNVREVADALKKVLGTAN